MPASSIDALATQEDETDASRTRYEQSPLMTPFPGFPT
jgi:hypothetical protein